MKSSTFPLVKSGVSDLFQRDVFLPEGVLFLLQVIVASYISITLIPFDTETYSVNLGIVCFSLPASWVPTVRIWNVPDCSEFRSGLQGHEERVHTVAWSPLFQTSAVKCSSSSLLDVDQDAGVVKSYDSHENPAQTNHTAINHDVAPQFSEGVHLASGGADSCVHLWSLNNMERVTTLEGKRNSSDC